MGEALKGAAGAVPIVALPAMMVALRPYNAASARAKWTASKSAKADEVIAIMVD